MKRLIYLDYDGVCNSHQSWYMKDEVEMDAHPLKLIMQADEWCMRNLKLLVKFTNAEIVICSSRRRHNGLMEWDGFLKSFQISVPLSVTDDKLPKVPAIFKHMSEQTDISSAVVIDDSGTVDAMIAKESIYKNLHMVKTSQFNGFTYSDMIYAAMKLDPTFNPPKILM